MKNAQQNMLNYYKTTLEIDNLTSVEYSTGSKPFWKLSARRANAVRDGQLDEKLTDELFETYFKEKDVSDEDRAKQNTLNLILSLRTVKDGRLVIGALNLACSVNRAGKLSAEGIPWIPAELLKSDFKTDLNESTKITVGNLSDYWEFKRERDEEFTVRAESWQDYLNYADELFECVTQNADSVPDDSEESVAASDMYIRFGDHTSSHKVIIDLYKRLSNEENLPVLFENMLDPNDNRKNTEEFEQDENILLNMCAEHASLTQSDPVVDSRRNIIYACATMDEGEVVAVSNLDDDEKTAVLQSIVADMVVQHALEKVPAPLIVGTATENQTTLNLLDSFSDVSPKTHDILNFRWLPVKQQFPAAFEELPDVPMLSGIAAYCPKTDDLSAQTEFELIETKRKSGVYAEYSEKSYIKAAAEFVRSYASNLFEETLPDVASAQTKLYDCLVNLDDARQNLIKAAFELKSEYGLIANMMDIQSMSPQERFAEQLTQANERCSFAQSRLDYWKGIEADRPMKGLFSKKPITEDADLLEENKQTEDTFDDSIKTLEEVKSFYQHKIDEQNGIIADLEKHKKAYEQCEQKYDEALQNIKNLVAQIDHTQKMSKSINAFENKTTAYDEAFLSELDKLLDTTVRYEEFWLALHYYECQWIIDCSTPSKMIDNTMRRQKTEEIQKMYWQEITSITPCFIMTEDQLPQYFELYKRGQGKPDLERIDLLIVDDANRINTPLMLASFALAKNALVIGGDQELTPAWVLTPDADKEIAADNDLSENWDEKVEYGLTSSTPSSIMRVASHVCEWDFEA